MAATTLDELVIPEVFTPYVQNLTEEKSRIIASGAGVVDAQLSGLLAGGGLVFTSPSFNDLANSAENISTDNAGSSSTPNAIVASQEKQVRLSRNNSWGSLDLAGDVAGADPMEAIAQRVATYWARRHQAAFIATIKGVFADNATIPGADEHVLNDMTHDISATEFANGITNFSAEAFIDATATMGDSMENLSLVVMHSLVYARALKNNLIDFVSDAVNPDGSRIPTFLGRNVIVDDSVPSGDGVFETWLFSAGAVRLGVGAPLMPTEVERVPAAGTGGGLSVLHNRVEWIIHPVGCSYIGTAPDGGPNNTADTHMLAAAGSWIRAFAERKQIGIARLISREF